MEQFSLVFRAMTRVTLADVILRRVPLTAREAVTLTLSVAKEWDRQRTLHGPVALPDAGAIHLHENGNVSILVTPGSSSEQTTGETLSSLLGRLLGTDEAGSPHLRSALVTAPRGVDAADVPAVPDESFRSVLTRFADDDYSTLVGAIVARTVKASAESTLALTPERTRIHVGPERRRQPRIVAELRLDIRELEQELFALRAASQRPPSMGVKVNRRVAVRTTLAAAAAGVLALLTIVAIERNPMRSGTRAVDGLPGPGIATGSPELPAVSAPAPATVDSSAAVVEGVRVVSTPRRSTAIRRPLARRPPASRTASPPSHRSPPFPGGTRSITWLANGR